MKTLVVYYSRTGTTQRLAQIIAERLHADTEKLVDMTDRSGALGYLRAGRDAMQKLPARIAQPTHNPADYDLVILCTPVWAWTITPAMRTYVVSNTEKLSRFGLVVTSGGADGAKVIKEFEKLCGKPAGGRLAVMTKQVIQATADQAITDFIRDVK